MKHSSPTSKMAAPPKKTPSSKITREGAGVGFDLHKMEEVESQEEQKVASQKSAGEEKEFNIEEDPDMPEDCVNSNVIIEEIEMNGKK